MKVLEAHTGRPEVGHTSANADGLVAALRAEGFSSDELVDAGLAYRRVGGGPLGDFYRQRVLIPIRDDQERVVGIIGRNVGDQQRWAKYKNPPCTAIYDKSVNVYQPLATPVDPGGQVIVVEGTLDAIPADIYIALGLAAQAARSRSKHPGEGQFRRAEHGASIATLRPIADESRVALLRRRSARALRRGARDPRCIAREDGGGASRTSPQIWGVSLNTAYKWSSRGQPDFPRTVRLRNGAVRVRDDWYEAWLSRLEK